MADPLIDQLEESIRRTEEEEAANQQAAALLEQSLNQGIDTEVEQRAQVDLNRKFPTMGYEFGPGSDVAALQQNREVRAEQERQDRINEIRRNIGQDAQYVPENFGDFDLEYDISRSIEPTDIRAKFLREYPQGDLKMVRLPDGSTQFIGRENADSPYRDVGSLGASALQGVSSGPAIGGLAGAVVGGPIGAAAGAALGEVADRLIERSRGFEQDVSGTRIAGRAAGEAAISYGIDKALSVAARGRWNPLNQYQIDAVESQLRQGLPPLQRGQLGGDFAQGLLAQSSLVSKPARTRMTEQRTEVLRRVQSLSPDDLTGLSDSALQQAVNLQADEIFSMLPTRGQAREVSGEQLQRALQNWDALSETAINRAYADAFQKAGAENLQYDVTNVKEFFQNQIQGVVTGGAEGGTVRAGFNPMQNARLRDFAERVAALPDQVSAYRAGNQEFSSFEFMKEFRTEAGRLINSPDPEVSAFAKRLWGELKETMENPVGDVSEEFMNSYRNANQLFKETEDIRELSYISRALRTDTPSEVARKFISPTNPEMMRTLKETLPTAEWENARGFFMEDMATRRNPQSALNQLDEWRQQSPSGLRAVLTEREEGILRTALTRRQQLESGTVSRALQQNLSDGERGLRILERGSQPEIRQLVETMGGASSETAASIRAAIWNDILERSTRASDTGEDLAPIIDFRRMADRMEYWKEKGTVLGTAFDDASMKVFDDMQTYAIAAGGASSDVGASMMVGSMRQQLTTGVGEVPAQGVGKLVDFLHKQLSNTAFATFLSRPVRYNGLARFYDNNERLIRSFSFETQQMIRSVMDQVGSEEDYQMEEVTNAPQNQ